MLQQVEPPSVPPWLAQPAAEDTAAVDDPPAAAGEGTKKGPEARKLSEAKTAVYKIYYLLNQKMDQSRKKRQVRISLLFVPVRATATS